jgi:NAD-dependent deacetylase
MNLNTARQKMQLAQRIAVLTGAGISAPSGIPTFRDAQGMGGDLRLRGLWKDFRVEDFATPQAYARDPQKVWEWYAWRYKKVMEAQPNKAHRLVAEIEGKEKRSFTLVTQNVDGLHARAGSANIVELHGNITRGRCERCGERFALPEPAGFVPPPSCPKCGTRGRPDVVWFGELLPQGAVALAEQAFTSCEVAMVIGTSAQVEPAASLARVAGWAGAYVIEINPEETPLSHSADLSLRMGAIEGLEELT